MNVVTINPKFYTETYLLFLNKCFPNWGDVMTYNWVFERIVGNNKSDIMLLSNEESEIIAGSGVTYRNLEIDNEIIPIGIMTGSWTLPESRGRGCFTQIIEESLRLCEDKNVPYLTAFVVNTNASYRRLRDAGFYCLPANNYFSTEDLFEIDESFFEFNFVENIDLEYFYNAYNKQKGNKFYYSKEEFEHQYIKRINKTFSVRINNVQLLFEENETTVRLLFITDFDVEIIQYFCNLMRKTKNKKVMFFVSEKEQIHKCNQANFHTIEGFFTIKETAVSTRYNTDYIKKLNISLADKI